MGWAVTQAGFGHGGCPATIECRRQLRQLVLTGPQLLVVHADIHSGLACVRPSEACQGSTREGRSASATADADCSLLHSFIHLLLIPSLTTILLYPLKHSLNHTLTYSPTQSITQLTNSPTLPLTHSSSHWRFTH